MKVEIIKTSCGDVEVYERSIPKDIPEGKTPIRGLGLHGIGKIYDEVIFVETELVSGKKDPSPIIEKLVKKTGQYQKTLLFLDKFFLKDDFLPLQIECNVFNIEENKWEGWSTRRGTT